MSIKSGMLPIKIVVVRAVSVQKICKTFCNKSELDRKKMVLICPIQ